MPYTPQHRARTRARIVNAARQLFNQHGFEATSIDQIMAQAGLTRGAFYHHFESKEAVFGEAVTSFLDQQRPKEADGPAQTVGSMMGGYMSQSHLNNVSDQCPMIAVPSDVARASPQVRDAYGRVFKAMLAKFENSLSGSPADIRRKALILSTLSIGGMVVARALDDPALQTEIIEASKSAADDIGKSAQE